MTLNSRTRRTLTWGVGLGLVFVLFLMFSPPLTPTATTPTLSATQQAQIIALVDKAVRDGLITKIDWRLNQAWVNPHAWAASNAQDKETFARVLAKYCEVQGDVARITIYDARSARELAGISAGRFYAR